MWQEDRHQRIRALLGTLQRVSMERIMAELGVSRETVRRDLLDLETLGVLVRVRGGAVRPDPADGSGTGGNGSTGAHPGTARERVARAERAIARAAAAQVCSGQTLFLHAGAGTIVTTLADLLAAQADLTILTNSLEVAARLRPTVGGKAANEVVVLGGTLGTTGAGPMTAGADTVREIRRHRVDLALLAPSGLDARHGASLDDRAQAEVARAMCEAADRVAMLADASRLGVRSRVSCCPIDAIDLLVTPRGAQGKATERAFVALKQRVKTIVPA